MPRGFSAISILSLLLCVAALAMWARSYTRSDELLFGHAMATAEHGTIAILVWQPNKGFVVVTFTTSHGTRHALQWPQGPSAATPTIFLVPYGMLTLLFLIAPLIWLVLWGRAQQRARRVGYCPACGYDLTGNASGMCPECGRPMATEVLP